MIVDQSSFLAFVPRRIHGTSACQHAQTKDISASEHAVPARVSHHWQILQFTIIPLCGCVFGYPGSAATALGRFLLDRRAGQIADEEAARLLERAGNQGVYVCVRL